MDYSMAVARLQELDRSELEERAVELGIANRHELPGYSYNHLVDLVADELVS